jgi:DNA topoisomerase-1
VLGKDPETGLDVTVKAGRFGPYIQLGEQKDYEEGEKPRRAGIPKNMSPGDMELDLALKLLSLPREIGKHPETGEPITAGIGRFGAVTQIAEKVAKGPSGRRFGADPGKPLGEHPSLGGVAVKNGRYGAYVTAGGVNATIPSDKTPETITLAEAIALIDERAAKGGGKAKRAAKKAAPKKAAKTTTKTAGKAPDPDAPKPAKKAAPKKAAAKPKSDSVSKARAPVSSAAKTSAKPAAPSKTPAKKSAGKARG